MLEFFVILVDTEIIISPHITAQLNIVSPVVGEVSVFICQMIVLE